MLKYILKRLGQAVIVFLLISFFSYMVLFLIPGDPIYAMYGANITPELYKIYYEKLEMDKPLPLRFFNWFFSFIQGDFGFSNVYKLNTSKLIADRLPITMYIGVLSLLLTAIFGITFGVIAALRRGSWQDSVITVMANIGSTLPLFWLGVVGVYIFSIRLGWLPSSGFTSPFVDFRLSLRQTIMPVCAMAFCQIANIARMTRSNMLEVVNEDYVRTARSKGLSERNVIWSHLIPNAISPVINMFSMLFRVVVAGAVAIEKIFNIPGMGQLMVNSIIKKDVNPLQACIVIVSSVVLVLSLLIDIIYAAIDPRIRLS